MPGKRPRQRPDRAAAARPGAGRRDAVARPVGAARPQPDGQAGAQPDVTPLVSGPLVRLGTIVGPHGIKGAVRVKTFTEDPMSIAAYGPVYDRAGRRRLDLQVVGPAKAGAVVRVAGVADRDGAEALRGLDLFVPRAALPAPADAEEFYHADLIGLLAEDAQGNPLGRVADVQDFGAGPILEIRGEAELLLPFTRETVPQVDLASGRLQVVPPAEVMAGDSDGEGNGERPEAAT